MSLLAFQKIRQACKLAQAHNLKLVRGPHFIFVENKLQAVNALGAILWVQNKENGWTDVRSYLDEDDFWLLRFCLGWDHRKVVSILDPKTLHEIAKDDVSKAAFTLAKELLG